MTTMTIMDLRREIAALEAVEVHVSTNQGTYGALEACRKIGSGDPRFANREVYETVGGARRETGPDEDCAPGRMRQINRQLLAGKRAELSQLRSRLGKMLREAR